MVCVWKLEGCGPDSRGTAEGNLTEDGGKENWTVIKMMRGHLEDVYDLCWSPDSAHLISGSVDNTAIVWDIQKGTICAYTHKQASLYLYMYMYKSMYLPPNLTHSTPTYSTHQVN